MKAELKGFPLPFGEQCAGCKLVDLATKLGGIFVLTCIYPESAGVEAVLLATQINLGSTNLSSQQSGLCQVIESDIPAQTTSPML